MHVIEMDTATDLPCGIYRMRDGRYQARVETKGRNGKPTKLSIGTFTTVAEALAALVVSE
jgi:hypothetical protein